jgi:hypothetical protein
MIRTIAAALALLAIPAFAFAQTPGVPGGGQTQSKMTTPGPKGTTPAKPSSAAKGGKHHGAKSTTTHASPSPMTRASARP